MSEAPPNGSPGRPTIHAGVALEALCSLRVGGPATELWRIDRAHQVADAIAEAARRDLPWAVLGGGSNLIVPDAGYPGVLLHLQTLGAASKRDGDHVELTVQAGERWDDLVARCAVEGLSGLEALSGIPGSVGGTPIQNVGAYGTDVAEWLVSVECFDSDARRIVTLDRAALQFRYRWSILKATRRYVVLSVRLRLPCQPSSAPIRYAELARALGVTEGAAAPIQQVRDAVLALRRSKGMVLDPNDPDSVSVGSFFTNPVVSAALAAGVEQAARARCELAEAQTMPRFAADGGRVKLAAAWLVERSGFRKGHAFSPRVRLSRKHSLAIVNAGGATAAEVLEFAATISAEVERRYGVRLEREPVVLGEALGEPS